MTGQGNTEEYCQNAWSGMVSEQCVPGSALRSLNAVSEKCSNSKKIYVTKTPPKTAIKNRGSGPVSQPKETLLQTFIIQKPRHTRPQKEILCLDHESLCFGKVLLSPHLGLFTKPLQTHHKPQSKPAWCKLCLLT